MRDVFFFWPHNNLGLVASFHCLRAREFSKHILKFLFPKGLKNTPGVSLRGESLWQLPWHWCLPTSRHSWLPAQRTSSTLECVLLSINFGKHCSQFLQIYLIPSLISMWASSLSLLPVFSLGHKNRKDLQAGRNRVWMSCLLVCMEIIMRHPAERGPFSRSQVETESVSSVHLASQPVCAQMHPFGFITSFQL